MNDFLKLDHPYSRYGLAIALYNPDLSPDEITPSELPGILANAIEAGLSEFRLHTSDDPELAGELRYDPIKLSALRADPKLVQSAGLAAQGKYLAPTVVTTDGDAKGTFDNAEEIIRLLRNNGSLMSPVALSRSFAPTTMKINNGRSTQAPPRTTLLEAACAVITTLTAVKPASWTDGRNTAVIPDLDLPALIRFIKIFDRMKHSALSGLYTRKLTRKEGQKKAPQKSGKSEYKRPYIYDGNYPYAPRDMAAFGAIGVLAAIGKWADHAGETSMGREVLESVAGTEEKSGRPLYIISYDSISQAQFSHHIVGLSMSGKLSDIIMALNIETVLYSEIDSTKSRWDSPAYQLFNMMSSRFLQQFHASAFRDFLAFRAEYSSVIQPLFEEYFMSSIDQPKEIVKEIVESARAFGQWLNLTAFLVANGEVDTKAQDRHSKVAKEKAKILAEFESTAMGAKNSLDLIARISIRAGRFLYNDAPPAAARFIEAAACDEISFEQTRNLIAAFSRLRSPKAENTTGIIPENITETSTN